MKPNQETTKTNLERSAYVTNNLLLLSLVVDSQMTEKATTKTIAPTPTNTHTPIKHHCGKQAGIAIILLVVLICRMKSCVEFSSYSLEVPDFKQHNTSVECIVVVVVVVVNNKRRTHHANPLAPLDARA